MTGRQSDSRVPGRSGAGVPASFGRVQEEAPEDEAFQLVGGKALRMVLHVDAIPSPEAMRGLYEAVRDNVAQAVIDGYAAGVAAMEQAAADADGGSSPGD